jgi:hypothetical protein
MAKAVSKYQSARHHTYRVKRDVEHPMWLFLAVLDWNTMIRMRQPWRYHHRLEIEAVVLVLHQLGESDWQLQQIYYH